MTKKPELFIEFFKEGEYHLTTFRGGKEKCLGKVYLVDHERNYAILFDKPISVKQKTVMSTYLLEKGTYEGYVLLPDQINALLEPVTRKIAEGIARENGLVLKIHTNP